jgi:hypothetical protein
LRGTTVQYLLLIDDTDRDRNILDPLFALLRGDNDLRIFLISRSVFLLLGTLLF